MNIQTRLNKMVANLRKTQRYNTYGQVQRHRWTPEELSNLITKYQQWSEKAGPSHLFKLKDFILSTRDSLPIFTELNDKQYYERVKRTLYRTLAKTGTAWRHFGKTRLTQEVTDPTIEGIVNQLEEQGVSIATDGSVLLVFPVEYYTHQPSDGYFVPTIGHAITHLKKMIGALDEDFEELTTQAQKVIELLQQFAQAWRSHPEREQVFDPNIKKKLPSEEYSIAQNPDKPTEYTITKADGTTYTCDVAEHKCTCPAGEAGRMCKHLNNLLFQ